MLLTLCMLPVLTACGDEDPYIENLLTLYDWELVMVNDRPVREIDVCEFQFFDFGNGSYGRYNALGQWYTIPITWDVLVTGGGAEYLYVYPVGSSETWEYIMRLYGGRNPQLELRDLYTGDVLLFQAY